MPPQTNSLRLNCLTLLLALMAELLETRSYAIIYFVRVRPDHSSHKSLENGFGHTVLSPPQYRFICSLYKQKWLVLLLSSPSAYKYQRLSYRLSVIDTTHISGL
jgi:hypothetical protein